MSTPQTIKQQLQADIAQANQATGRSTSNVHDAITQLIDGWHQQPQEPVEKDVIFIDYDGTILYSYSKDEFLLLDQMPATVSHNGLVSEGWNWSLQDAKQFVQTMGGNCIGQMYSPQDGKTHIRVSVDDNVSQMIRLIGKGSKVDVDWGDGSQVETFNDSAQHDLSHTYQPNKEYDITIGGRFAFRNGTGPSHTNLQQGSCIYVHSQNSQDDTNYINHLYRKQVRSVILSKDVIGQYNGLATADYSSYTNYLLTSLISLEYVIVQPHYESKPVYFGSYPLTNVRMNQLIVPTGIKTISPQQVSSIRRVSFNKMGGEYYGNSTIKIAYIYNGNPLNIDGCKQLKKICVDDTVTTMQGYGLRDTFNFTTLHIPKSITTIQANAFYVNGTQPKFKKLYFHSVTPPTLSATSSINPSSLQSDCEIHVPVGYKSVYESATNYPSSSTYTYIDDVIVEE